ACDIEEQRSLGVATESVWPAECILLGDSGNRKRLARKSGKQQVVLGDTGGFHLADIASDFVIAVEIRAIGLLRVFIPFACKNALTTEWLETQPQPTNTGEEVYKGERRIRLLLLVHKRTEEIEHRALWLGFAAVPAIDCARRVATSFGRF